MKEPPGQTFAHILGDLLAVPGEFIACLEWQRVRPGPDATRHPVATPALLQQARVAHQLRVTRGARPEEMLVDESATATVKQLGDALTEMEVNGHVFGRCSLTLVLHSEDRRALDQQAAAGDEGACGPRRRVLRRNLQPAERLAEHRARQRRPQPAAARAARNARGRPELSVRRRSGRSAGSPLLRAPLATFETPHQTPFAYHLHVQDVGHTLVLGATGSGKSFLLNFLVTHAQQYDPFTVILDLGTATASSRRFSMAATWSWACDSGTSPSIRSASSRRPSTCTSCTRFVRVLLEGEDGYRLSELEDREVYEAVENLYVLERSQRRLFTLANLLPRALMARLQKWVEGGRYADLFDNVDDTLTFERLQVFDFEAMRAYPALLEPLLFYVLHRVNERLHDPAETPDAEALRHGRGVALHPAPDASRLRAGGAEDLAEAERRHDSGDADHRRLRLGRSAADGRRELPDEAAAGEPGAGPRTYAELFQLNEMELDLLAGLIAATADPAEAAGPDEGADPGGRSQELLDLHEHAHRQRAGRRDVPGARLRGGPRPPRGLGLNGRCDMGCSGLRRRQR